MSDEMDDAAKQEIRNLFPSAETGVRALFGPVPVPQNNGDVFGILDGPKGAAATPGSAVAPTGDTTDLTGGGATALGNSWDSTSGDKVTYKTYREYRKDEATVTVTVGTVESFDVVTAANYASVSDLLSSSDYVTLAVVTTTGGSLATTYVFPFASSSPGVYTNIARASAATEYTVPIYGGVDHFVKTINSGPPAVEGSGGIALIPTTAATTTASVYNAGGALATVPDATGIVGVPVVSTSGGALSTDNASSITGASGVASIISGTTPIKGLSDDSVSKVYKVYQITIFSRTIVADFDGTLLSISAETQEDQYNVVSDEVV